MRATTRAPAPFFGAPFPRSEEGDARMNHLAKPASPVGDETKLAALRRDFSIPARQPLSPAQADALRRAHQFTQPHEEGDLACWRFGDQEPLIVLVHGWSGRGTDLLRFVPPLRAA